MIFLHVHLRLLFQNFPVLKEPLLYNVNVRIVNEHLRNIFADSELQKDSVIRNFRITASDGKSYDTMHYNLSTIIAFGYKVNSERSIQFRKWATTIIDMKFGDTSDLFGNEKDNSCKSVIGAVYQTFDEKAANCYSGGAADAAGGGVPGGAAPPEKGAGSRPKGGGPRADPRGEGFPPLWLSCEVRKKVSCGYGFSEEVALVEHVATGCKEVGLLLGFDAFGNYFKPQVLCDGDDAFD